MTEKKLYYSHDYDQDTEISYTLKGKRAKLEITFTSEDPDCGKETAEYASFDGKTMRDLAKDWLEELSGYLDEKATDQDIKEYYGEYTKTALYAFEGALKYVSRIHQFLWDDLLDPAFAAIYAHVLLLEKEEKCDPDMDSESLAFECKKLAHEFVEMYDNDCKYGCPDYWELLDSFADKRPRELWPPKKRFDVLIDGNVTMTYKVWAKDKEEAEEVARKFMEMPPFEKRFREEMTITETHIGDVID